MSNKKEVRVFPAEELRVRRDDDGNPIIQGHAAVFNKLSLDLGGFREKVAKGTFERAIKEDDVRALFNHDPNHVLGRTKSKTLRMAEDDRGLGVEIDPPETQMGRDVVTSIDRGDLDGMSFGFRTIKDSWEHGEDGAPDIRTLEEVELFDVSPVTFPAYPDTNVAVRSHKDWLDSETETVETASSTFVMITAGLTATRTVDLCDRELYLRTRSCRGQSLARLLNRLVAAKAGDGPVSDVKEAMGSAAGISASTVGQIMATPDQSDNPFRINCPPISRLRAFARVLGVPVSQLVNAAENDGCDYNGSD